MNPAGFIGNERMHALFAELRRRYDFIVVDTDPCEAEGLVAAEAVAGAMPVASSRVVDVTPYAMPREPSMSWAMSPTMPKTMSCRMEAAFPLREDC